MSEGWSVSQKEAIRTQLTIFAGVVSVEFIDGVDGGRLNLLVDETLEALEAITKGDEQ